MPGKKIRVVAAILYNEAGEFLMARKKAGKVLEGLWEFPGGKIEEGEDPPAALRREIQEELDITLEEVQVCFEYEYSYPDLDIHFVFLTGVPGGSEIRLTDHDAICWVTPDSALQLDVVPGDLPAIQQLKKASGGLPLS